MSSLEQAAADQILDDLQDDFISHLAKHGDFVRHNWHRNSGNNGGGYRYQAADKAFFNQASVNISKVYGLANITAASSFSAIIHPDNPHTPSLHLHLSWTCSHAKYWRFMADLNPAIANAGHAELFANTLQRVAGEHYKLGTKQGDEYFNIPALGRRRGLVHFYLEGINGGNMADDCRFAKRFGRAIIQTYCQLLSQNTPSPNATDYRCQLAYHTLYLLQVLTLDAGTTAGILAHQQNDLGVMVSLPAHIDLSLLNLWQEKLPPAQKTLLAAIIQALPKQNPCPVSLQARQNFADIIRQHYAIHPTELAKISSKIQQPNK